MLILNPISKERIWGTSRLHDYSGDKDIEKIGSIFTLSAIEGLSNSFSHPDFEETDLYSAMQNHPEKFGLERGEEYPIIVSMTGADADLSIQVHPTDEYAKKHEGKQWGKGESWYFIDEPDSSWIYAESKLDDKEAIELKMKNGEFEEVIDRLNVAVGDLVYIPSGTLHALTKGSLVYEIQQSTDITYRFYDYERTDKDGNKRELHLQKAIDTLMPNNRVKKTSFEIGELRSEQPYDIVREQLEMNYHNDTPIAQAVTVIKGTLTVENLEVRTGQSIVVFPQETLRIQSGAEVVVATPHRYWDF